MFDAVLAPGLQPFTVALGLMGLIALTEAAGMLFGLSPSGLVDQMLPEADADLDADVHADVDGGGFLSGLLGWLCVGRVPVLVLLVALLTSFGIAGFVVQGVMRALFGWHLPAIIAVVPALALALPPTRWLALGLQRVMPKEETDAVSTRTFIGRVATITRGTARAGQPAEAKLRDGKGQTQYVLIEPDEADASFTQGAEVLVTREIGGGRYAAIRNDNSFLTG